VSEDVHAASEYVPCTSQADTEEAELALERTKLSRTTRANASTNGNLCARGLEPLLANQVAQQLIAYDELGAYARDELVSPKNSARAIAGFPFSCMQLCSWSHDALIVTAIAPEARLIPIVSLSSLSSRSNGRLAHARVAQGDDGRNSRDVLGGLAMAMTAGIGWLVGALRKVSPSSRQSAPPKSGIIQYRRMVPAQAPGRRTDPRFPATCVCVFGKWPRFRDVGQVGASDAGCFLTLAARAT